jgi:hypothetical protein
MSKSAEDIIWDYCQGRLNPNPDYYEGHGNELRDLNSPILEMVYQGILTEHGAGPAKAFVNMVKNLRDTNATSFLNELYRMEKKGWRWGEPVLKVRVSTDKKEEGVPVPTAPSEPVKRTVGEILNAFRRGASSVGHDKAITYDFLAAHKSEVDSSLFSSSFGG